MSKIYLFSDNNKSELYCHVPKRLEGRTYKLSLECGFCKQETDITGNNDFIELINMIFPHEHNYSLEALRDISIFFQLEEEYFEKTKKYAFVKQLGNQSPITFVKKVTCPSCGQVYYCCFALTGDHTHSPGQFLHLVGIKTV
jgi:hypothetical protein